MPEGEAFTVRFPAELVRRARAHATLNGQSIEDVLAEWVEHHENSAGDLMVAIHGGEGLDLRPLMELLEKDLKQDREKGDQ